MMVLSVHQRSAVIVTLFLLSIRYSTSQNVSPALRVPVVTSVSPLFGPVAGGTLITLTGRWLNYSDSYVTLHPVDETLYDVITLSNTGDKGQISYDTFIVVTPEVNNDSPIEAITHLAVNLVFSDGPAFSTNSFFDYHPNPVVTGAEPTDHPISGGTLVTLSGVNMDSAAVPVITVVTVVQRFNSTDASGSTYQNTSSAECFNATSTAVKCPMPHVPLPPDFESSLNLTNRENSSVVTDSGNGTVVIRGPNGRDRATVIVGTVFDGDKTFDNFAVALPNVTFEFYPPPVFIEFTAGVIEFDPINQSYIEILGKNMKLGARLVDYKVFIGADQCVGLDLTDTVLRCQPPHDEPPMNVSSNDMCSKQKLNSVLVSVGYTNPFRYACIRYVKDPVNIALIVGLVVGLGVPFIVLVVVIVVYLIHRNSNSVKNTNNVYSTTQPQLVAKTSENKQARDSNYYGVLTVTHNGDVASNNVFITTQPQGVVAKTSENEKARDSNYYEVLTVTHNGDVASNNVFITTQPQGVVAKTSENEKARDSHYYDVLTFTHKEDAASNNM